MSNVFHLQSHLDDMYANTERQFTFRAETTQGVADWQIRFREAVKQVLKIADRVLPESPTVERLSSVDKGSYVEEKFALDMGDVLAPMYLLVPKTDPPYIPVVALHGHGPGVQLILGNDQDELRKRDKREINDNFAQLLAEEGYFVCALEQRGFGDRVANHVNDKSQNSCRHLAFEYMLHGRTLLGERLRDAIVAIHYLQHREDIIFDSLASVGFSGGGTTALLLSALDERIQSTVVASYFCSFKQSILGVPHCECNYVPGILELGEMGDIASLIAPRKLCIISGENDLIFPINGVYEQIETVKQAYQTLNVQDACTLILHEGDHEYRHDLVSAWLKDHLI